MILLFDNYFIIYILLCIFIHLCIVIYSYTLDTVDRKVFKYFFKCFTITHLGTITCIRFMIIWSTNYGT